MSDGEEGPSTSRKLAWSVASDINVVAAYRLGVGFMITLVVGLISYIGVNVIDGQSEISKGQNALATQVAVGNQNIANTIALIDAANHRVDLLLGRVNDLDHRTTVIETKMENTRGR